MRKKFYFAASLCALSLATSAQKIDFDMSGRQTAEVCEPGFISWPVRQGLADTLKSVDGVEGFDIVVNCGPEGTVNRALRPQWNKGM